MWYDVCMSPEQPQEQPKPIQPEELPKEEEPVLGTHLRIQSEFKLKLFFLRNRRYLGLMALGLFLLIILLVAFANAGAIRNYFDKSLHTDSDNDGVVDRLDACPGFDDHVDENRNGIPDGCDERPPADFKIESTEPQLFQKSGAVDVFVQLRNASQEWGVKELGYKITLLDVAKQEVGSSSGMTYMLPLETAPLVELGLTTSAPAASATFEITSQKYVKLEQFSSLDLLARNVKPIQPVAAGDRFQVSGTVVNQTPYTFDQVDIFLTATDVAGKVLGVTRTVLNGFHSNTQRDFRIVWNLDAYTSVAKIAASTRVNVYKSDNFINVFRAQGGRYLEYGQ